MIRKAASHDLDAVEQICIEEFAWERRNGGLTGWVSGVWPSRTTLRRAIAKGDLVVVRDRLFDADPRMVWGFMVLSQDEREKGRSRAPSYGERGEVRYRTSRDEGEGGRFHAVAAARARPERRVLTLSILCVTPLAARHGLGTSMLRYALDRARRGSFTLRFVVPTANVPMTSLCAKMGYAPSRRAQTATFEGGPRLECEVYELR